MTWTGWSVARSFDRRVAAAARVGTATVDRVFNGRTGVRRDTRRRVLEAYAALNRQAVRDEAQAPLRIAFITEAGSSFNNALGAAVAAHADPAVVCSFHAVSASDVKPIGFGQTIERFAQSSQGLVVVARENLTINRAIRSAVARGVPVVCLDHRPALTRTEPVTSAAIRSRPAPRPPYSWGACSADRLERSCWLSARAIARRRSANVASGASSGRTFLVCASSNG